MIRRMLNSRAARKLRRNKLALVSMFIVGVYLLLAVAMTFGLVTETHCAERVGANRQPGFYRVGSNEYRLSLIHI